MIVIVQNYGVGALEIRLMDYVVAVAEEQSFTRAAARLRIAQPSLSQQVAKLEATLGMTLFQRKAKAVTLTADGLRFVARAKEILAMHDDFLAEMRERSQGMGDALTIGTTAITGGRLLPRLLGAFQTNYPNVRPSLVEESTEALTKLVAHGEIDLAILPLPVDDVTLNTSPILTEPLYLALPPMRQPWMTEEVLRLIASHDLHAPVSLTTVASAPFVLLKQGFGFRSTLLALCATDGFQPNIAYETSNIDTAQAMVANGLGVTVVPDMVVHRNVEPSPMYRELVGQPTRSLVFAYPRHRYVTLAARMFMDVATDTLRLFGNESTTSPLG